MSATFKVGERAIYVGKSGKREVTITEPLQLCHDLKGNCWFGYPTEYICPDGLRLCPRPHDLRKKDDDARPSARDANKITSWDKVGWSPGKVLESGAG